MRKKIAKLRKIQRATFWAIGAMWVSLIFIGLLEENSGPYFDGLFVLCCAVSISLEIFQAILARKLLRCPYCLRYSPPAAEAFMRGKEETFRCPHCGKEIPGTKE